jgi:hypothetical protein
VYSSMRLGVPFIAPRQLGAVESNLGRLILPYVDWRTGHCPVPDFLPKLAQSTVGSQRAIGAPDMCPAQIVRSTVGPADRWLTGQSGAHRTVR